MSLVIKRVKEISRKKKKSGWRSRRLQQLHLQQLEEEEEQKKQLQEKRQLEETQQKQLEVNQQTQLQLEETQQKQLEVNQQTQLQEKQQLEETQQKQLEVKHQTQLQTENEKENEQPPEPPYHKRPLLSLTGDKEEPNNKRRCRPCKSCRSRVNTKHKFEFIEPAPRNYHKHLDLFAIVEMGSSIVFYKKDRVDGPCCGAPVGRCDRYRLQGQQEAHGHQGKGYYAPPPAENGHLTRGCERITRNSFLYRFPEPNPPLPPPPPPQFIWTKYGPDNRLSMIYLWNRYDPYLADSKWRRKYGEQMALLRHRNYLAGNRGGFVHTPYN